jgi:hypothetical protein
VIGVFVISDAWRDYVVDPGRQGIFLVLAAFLASFLFIRTSSRLSRSRRVPWWPGSVVVGGGLHLHHLVWGIALMLSGGTLGFAVNGASPWFELTAIMFGLGAGFTLDEFALWVHLKDVYWTDQGRSSIDAVAVTAAFMGLVLFGVDPLKIGGGDTAGIIASVGGSLLVLLASAACFAKGRFVFGFATLILPPLGLWGALRLGKPESAWARWRYGDRDPERLARAEQRFRPDRPAALWADRARELIGGFPARIIDAPTPPPDGAASREAARTVAARAEAEAQRRGG